MMKVVSRSVCAFVYRWRDDEVEFLLLRRPVERGSRWQPVIGRIKKRERAEDAAVREVLEETGFDADELVFLDKVNVCFKPGKRRVYLEPCFGIGVDGEDPVLSEEHDRFVWQRPTAAASRLSQAGLREAIEELYGRLLEDAARDRTVELRAHEVVDATGEQREADVGEGT